VQGNEYILAAAAAKSGGNPLFLPMIMVLIFGAFYFLMIRPQKAKQRAQLQMQKEIEPGTRVMTTNGMFATVVEVNDDGVILEIAPGVEAQFVSQAIMKVIEEDVEDEEETEDDETKDEEAEEATETEAATSEVAKPTAKPTDKAGEKPSA
jgi:preprotein translocase subunit YajC